MAYTSVKISADSSSYQSQMKSAASQMKVLSAEYTTAATKAKLFGSETDSLKQFIQFATINGTNVTQSVDQVDKIMKKELGGGTGQIKLRYVYDMFVARFTWLARVISFEAFSMMVDEALERMKKMLESNKAMQTLVSGEAGETVEKDM